MCSNTCELVGDRTFVDKPVFTLILVVLFDLVSGATEETFPDLLIYEVKHVDDSGLAFATYSV